MYSRRKVPSKYVLLCSCGLFLYLLLVLLLFIAKDYYSSTQKYTISHFRVRKHRQSSSTPQIQSIRPSVQSLQSDAVFDRNYTIHSNLSYPKFQSLYDILKSWPPDNPDLYYMKQQQNNNDYPFIETLQCFNYSDPIERELAAHYKQAELPFKLYDIPNVEYVRKLWTDSYLIENIPSIPIEQTHVEQSNTNHFMYWNKLKVPSHPLITQEGEQREEGQDNPKKGYSTPTVLTDMTFEEWLYKAYESNLDYLTVKTYNSSSVHYYYIIGVAKDDEEAFINRDLSIFHIPQTDHTSRHTNFFISNLEDNKGIQCRFGMRGIIAEAHYDSGRNMIAMLKGTKRYILTPPSTCEKLGIITDPSHPSYRHSEIDWSNLEEATAKGFDQVPAIDTIVHEGEILYVPSFWFHYIISLSYSIQCNSRSGTPPNSIGKDDINRCFMDDSEERDYDRKKNRKNRKKKLKGFAPIINGKMGKMRSKEKKKKKGSEI